MTAPTQKIRTATYIRDRFTCVACGAQEPLSWQHRESSGHGGRGRKAPPLTTADGVTLCLLCNQAAEADMQGLALQSGWKLRRNRGSIQSHQIPFWNRNTNLWALPDMDGGLQPINTALALELIDAAGGNYVKGVLSR
jgi:hypothetical protein